jgi:hypothetical protein
MKRNTSLTLFMTAVLALSRPFAAIAADNPDDQKLHKKGPSVQGVSKPAVQATVVHAPVTPQTHVVQNKVQTNNFHKNVNTTNNNQTFVKQGNVNKNFHPGNTTVNNTTVNKTQVVAGGGKFTRANNYGGRWTAGDNHRDWDRGGEHSWNGHHYRWYDGGWLIVDDGFWPVPTVAVYSGGGGSLIASAQQQLANDGYYNGPIDGIAGPGTRNAIANFQNDNNLAPTGRLNEPTRVALGLE